MGTIHGSAMQIVFPTDERLTVTALGPPKMIPRYDVDLTLYPNLKRLHEYTGYTPITLDVPHELIDFGQGVMMGNRWPVRLVLGESEKEILFYPNAYDVSATVDSRRFSGTLRGELFEEVQRGQPVDDATEAALTAEEEAESERRRLEWQAEEDARYTDYYESYI